MHLPPARIMAYGLDRRLRDERHDASVHQPASYDQGARVVEAHRSRRTRDRARKVWYAHCRQVRFARWFGFIGENADLDRFPLDPPSTARPETTEPYLFSGPHMTVSC